MSVNLENMMSKIFKFLKISFYSPLLIPLAMAMATTPSQRKQLIYKDLHKYHTHCRHNGFWKIFLCIVFGERSYRNVLFYRLKHNAVFIRPFLQPNPTLHIHTPEIGSGLLVVHGDATYVYAKSIGENLYVNQCVTIGVVGNSRPIIGNNVRVATGAIVIGGIQIGDNVTIGAGAVVVKDVPSNTTVVGNPARIIKQNGKKVNIPL